jgi:hypothetical protein
MNDQNPVLRDPRIGGGPPYGSDSWNKPVTRTTLARAEIALRWHARRAAKRSRELATLSIPVQKDVGNTRQKMRGYSG